MASRPRTAAIITATLFALTAAVGCGALDKALDCVQTADAIAGNVNDLQQAVSDIGNDPGQVDQSLGDIDTELGRLHDKTDNADLSKAVDHLDKAVDNVRTAVDQGDETPDLTPVTDAAAEIGKICTP